MIHKFKAKDINILLDVNSGGVHVIDNITYDLLGYIEPPLQNECPEEIIEKLSGKYSIEEIKESYSEIVSLYEDKLLFSEDIYGDYAETAVESPVKAMCLHIAHDCNLRCKYCFAATGDFGTGRKLMPLETGKAAIDFLLEKSAGRENLEVDFFGGEPLMNFDVVKEIVKYARSKEAEYGKNFRFTITTNGMLLTDDKIDFINKEMSNVVLSIDGRKEVNDKMRVRVDGSGSYDKIVDAYKHLVEKRGDKEYYVRGTYTKYNLDFSEDVLHLYNIGFDQVSGRIYTIKEIHTTFHCFKYIGRRTNSHKINRFVLWKIWYSLFNYIIHLLMAFTDCQSAQCITIKFHGCYTFCMFYTYIFKSPTLVDTKKKLGFIYCCFKAVKPCHLLFTPFKPSCRPVC